MPVRYTEYSRKKIKEEPKKTTQKTSPLPEQYMLGDWQPITQETAKTPEQKKILEEAEKKAEATMFYSQLGQPALAEKYGVPQVEEGYEVESVKEVTPKTVAPLPRAEKYVEGEWVSKEGEQRFPSKETFLEVTLKPKEVYAPTQLFGPKTEFYSVAEGRMVSQELGYGKSAKKITLGTEKGMSLAESQALSGLGLTSVATTGLAYPIVGAFGVGGIVTAETVKYSITGEHISAEEAIGFAGVGELVGLGFLTGAKALQPRVQRSVEASFRRSIEKMELWKPTRLQQLSMKVTGVKPPTFAQELVGAGEPRGLSFAMIQRGEFVGGEESFFFDYPTPKSAQLYVKGYPATSKWVESTLVKRVYLEGLFTTSYSSRLLLTVEPKLEPKIPYIPKEPYLTTAAKTTGGFGMPELALPSLLNVEQQQQKLLQKVSQKQLQQTRTELMQESKEAVRVAQVVSQTQTQRQSQRQAQQLVPIQIQQVSQIQKQIQQQMVGATTPLTQVPKFATPYIPRAGGETPAKALDRLFGKWTPREHKVKPWDAMLRTFGVSTKRVPKSVMKISRMEVPSFGRAKPKSKVKRKRKSRRSKR